MSTSTTHTGTENTLFVKSESTGAEDLLIPGTAPVSQVVIWERSRHSPVLTFDSAYFISAVAEESPQRPGPPLCFHCKLNIDEALPPPPPSYIPSFIPALALPLCCCALYSVGPSLSIITLSYLVFLLQDSALSCVCQKVEQPNTLRTGLTRTFLFHISGLMV